MATLPSEADRQARNILQSVCTVLDQEFDVAQGIKAYVFGSVLTAGSNWADVDILLVITKPKDCDHLSSALASLLATVPLHLTFVLHSEFQELGECAWGNLHELF